jgi:hypothetical protein
MMIARTGLSAARVQSFRDFLKKEHADENLEFYLKCRALQARVRASAFLSGCLFVFISVFCVFSRDPPPTQVFLIVR